MRLHLLFWTGTNLIAAALIGWAISDGSYSTAAEASLLVAEFILIGFAAFFAAMVLRSRRR